MYIGGGVDVAAAPRPAAGACNEQFSSTTRSMSAVGLIPFEKATCAHLCELLNKWREPGPAQRVRSALVVPEAANREYTLLSVEHVHFIASKIRAEGFRGRRPGSSEGHDIPVVTRCGPVGKRDALGQESLDSWRARSAHHVGYPTVRELIHCAVSSCPFLKF